ncbi:MAG TPA: DNA mismatch repair protein MutS [Clostridiaceae bacterium]|nr:DNA mismatch repair protein MutS [Clostridiaceae bacterium]
MEIEVVVIILIVIAVIVISSLIKKLKRNRKIKDELINEWGKQPVEKYTSDEISNISTFFKNVKKSDPTIHYIDDITWNDLDMDKVYMRINNTQSTVGEEYLYYLLRQPVLEDTKLLERERLIRFFQENPKQRLALQFVLAKLGKRKYTLISDYLFNEEKRVPVKGMLYMALAIALLLSPLALAVNVPAGIMLIIGIMITNTTIYYKARNEISSHLDSLSYIVNMISCGKNISRLDIPEIEEYKIKLDSMYKKTKTFTVKSFYTLFYRTEDPFLEYIKVVFLGELIAFESLLKVIYRHRMYLKEIYCNIGLLDSLIAVASYRESLNYWTEPELYNLDEQLYNILNGTLDTALNKDAFLSKNSSNNSRVILEFEEIYHPLIEQPVANSARLSKPVLITGSNASGKSTFLKTIGINAILSQTIHTSLAKKYRSPYFLIYTSMALKDNLDNKESYYIAEIKSLKRIFDSINENIPCLSLIDEVLRGTNTVERIAASSEVLYNLANINCLCVAATHDIELSSILGYYYDNYHFQESFSGDDITFDYKLYPGRSNTRNAIKLLKIMGYEDNIVQAAEKRALKFIEEGKWTNIDDR